MGIQGTSSEETVWAVVDESGDGVRLDVWLPSVFSEITTRSFATQWIASGSVSVQRCGAKPGLRLRLGDRVAIKRPHAPQSLDRAIGPMPEALPLRILFEDEHLVVINKQPGLVVHPGAGVSSGTLVNAILAHCGATLPSLGDKNRSGIVHRLDRDTSGVMVVAKTQEALSGLSRQFASHEQHRLYWALCYGVMDPESGRMETGIARHPAWRTRFRAVALGEGKRAATRYTTVTSFAGGLVSLVECQLETGRTHQIRVHLDHEGHSLVGDAVYGRMPDHLGRKSPLLAASIRRWVTRQMLHARVLGFHHPVSKEALFFEAPLEPDFLRLRDVLSSI
jgi:23S rRNA pseudouridine1911/1915/1917 synthase